MCGDCRTNVNAKLVHSCVILVKVPHFVKAKRWSNRCVLSIWNGCPKPWVVLTNISNGTRNIVSIVYKSVHTNELVKLLIYLWSSFGYVLFNILCLITVNNNF